MKTHFLNFAAAALIVLAAASCNKEEIINTGGDGTKAIALSISIGEPGTKAFGLDDRYQNNYDDFTRLDIYFTNTGGTILYHWAASAAVADGNGKILWDNFVNAQNGVKFLGLSGDVTGVYVVANGKESTLEDGEITTGANIKDLNNYMKLISYGPAEDQNAMPYAGGDITLSPVNNVNPSAGTITVGDDSKDNGSYVLADIHLRPAISRVEIEQVGVKTSGVNYYKYADGKIEQVTVIPGTINDGEAYYSVAWNNFNVEFVGVYMSDVYRVTNLFPASSNIEQWNVDNNFFATPGFENSAAPIQKGAWASLGSETSLNNILAYSNYNGNTYTPFGESGYTSDEGDNSWLFNGGAESGTNTKVIPFHFFVPYNVTDDQDVQKVGDAKDVDPKLHFQFDKAEGYDDMNSGFTITQIKKYTADNQEGEVISTGQDIYDQLEVMYEWPVAIGDGMAYANVINFVDEDGADVDIKPGYIYHLKKVLIDPTNLNPAPSDNDVNNIYVEVEVVPFYVQDVYPVFE